MQEEEIFEVSEGEKFSLYNNLVGENEFLRSKIKTLQWENSNIKNQKDQFSNRSFTILPELDDGALTSPHRSKRSVTPSREFSGLKKSDSKKNKASDMGFTERNDILRILLLQAETLEKCHCQGFSS